MILAICAIGISTVSSCGRLETKKEFKLQDGFKDYFDMKAGSEWIYMKSSDTTILDTIIASNYQAGKMVYDAFTQEFFSYDLLSKRDSNFIVRAIADQNETDRIAIIRDDPGFNIGVQLYFDKIGFDVVDGRGDVLTQLDSFTVGDKTYKKVLKIVLNPNNAVFKNVYISPEVGIIRRDDVNGSTWILRKANIIR